MSAPALQAQLIILGLACLMLALGLISIAPEDWRQLFPRRWTRR